MVIVLLHGGTPEDDQLAAAVSGIDVIVAGHTHDTYRHWVQNSRSATPTLITQTGSNAMELGKLELLFTLSTDDAPSDQGPGGGGGGGGGVVQSIALLNGPGPLSDSVVVLNDDVPSDEDVVRLVDSFKKEVDGQQLFKHTYDTVVLHAVGESQLSLYGLPLHTMHQQTGELASYFASKVCGVCCLSLIVASFQTIKQS